MKYNDRMQPVWDQLEKGLTEEERRFNHKLIQNARQGDYLIKSQDQGICFGGYGYVNYTFRNDGWLSTGPRKKAICEKISDLEDQAFSWAMKLNKLCDE